VAREPDGFGHARPPLSCLRGYGSLVASLNLRETLPELLPGLLRHLSFLFTIFLHVADEGLAGFSRLFVPYILVVAVITSDTFVFFAVAA
jgi:hypothetical protein